MGPSGRRPQNNLAAVQIYSCTYVLEDSSRNSGSKYDLCALLPSSASERHEGKFVGGLQKPHYLSELLPTTRFRVPIRALIFPSRLSVDLASRLTLPS